jgi:hypothetical protein
MRRTELAETMAKNKRNDMLRQEFLRLVDTIKNQKYYSYEDFLEMEKRLTDPFLTEVVVENVPYKVFANSKDSGAFNLMVVSEIEDKLFGQKRNIDSVDDQNNLGQSKKAKTHHDHTALGRRQVPTHLPEDAIAAKEKLDVFDCNTKIKKMKSEKQQLQKEHKLLQKMRDDMSKLMEAQAHTYWNVSETDKKSHIVSLYRLFDGPAYSTKKTEEMKSYLSNPKMIVTKETTDHKVAMLQRRQMEIDQRVEEISAFLQK